ncbi:hypothetical protein BH24BAC1_BH24BAC1_30730 [soil metagenome]
MEIAKVLAGQQMVKFLVELVARVIKEDLSGNLPRVDEVPFDSTRKRMSTIHKASGPLPGSLAVLQNSSGVMFTKGAADSLLAVSDFVWVKGERMPVDPAWKRRILKANADLAGNGVRVLGLAFRELDPASALADLEQGLTFVGLVGMIDPPRLEVKSAVEKCKVAGIRTVMITGDHPLTAAAIRRDLNFGVETEPVTGEQLQRTDEEALFALAEKTSVYARVSPEDKLRIVGALQRRGEIVAMTGDGVNDSPALKKANIGVAMGITDTDVAKEAADMVLLDDNFATIGFAQMFQALALRSSAHSPFAVRTNPLMALVFISTVLLQLAVIYLPFMKGFFNLVPLPLENLLISVAAGSVVFFVIILDRKIFKR